MLFSQETRNLEVFTDLGPEVLVIESMTGNEQLSTLFRYHLKLLSENAKLQPEDMLSTPVTVRLNLPCTDGQARYFNGIVSHFVFTGCDGALATYEAILVPWTWHLTCKANHRIFQDKGVPEIVETIFNEHRYADFEYRLEGRYSKRVYCVQHGETDFDFITRLLAQEGIYYFFTHQKDGHIMILADNDYAHERIAGYEEIPYYPPNPSGGQVAQRKRDHIEHWSMAGTIQPGAFTHTDFNPLSPRTDLTTFDVFHHENDFTDFEFFEYPGGYAKREQGKQWAKVRTEEINVGFKAFSGSGDARGLTTGMRFALTGYPREDQNREYLILAAEYRLNSDAFGSSGNAGGAAGSEPPFYCEFAALDAWTAYRPPRPKPKPTVKGPQTAIVVGKAGEEIWTDQYGRVKVQFHWDRYGKADEHSSCWVRVSQSVAGKGWGTMSVPRIGQEVVVDFIDGDPDRPIITGRVYNGVNWPPYDLPGNATVTTIKTNSSKGGKGFNEIRIEDKKGEEQVFIHAEKDHEIRVKNDTTEWVGSERHLIVKKNQIEQVEGDKHLTVAGDHNEEVQGSVSLKTPAALQQKVGINYAVDAGKEIHLKSGMNLVLEAGTSITLKGGSGFIKVGPVGVEVSTPFTIGGGAPGIGAGCMPNAPKQPKGAVNAKPGEIPDVLNLLLQALAKAAETGDPLVAYQSPADLDCAAAWEDIRDEVKEIADIEDPEQRNRRISAAYAKIYLDHPELKWAGAAAFASKQVGCGMRELGTRFLNRESRNLKQMADQGQEMLEMLEMDTPQSRDNVDRLKALSDKTDVLKILGDGNRAVFLDIYPSLAFYANNKDKASLERILECLEEPPSDFEVSEKVISAFADIRDGRTDKAAQRMLHKEQRGPVQDVFDEPVMRLSNQLNRFFGGGLADLDLAIAAGCEADADHTVGYDDEKYGGPIEDFKSRWKFAGDVVDIFGEIESEEAAYLEAELGKIIRAAETPQ